MLGRKGVGDGLKQIGSGSDRELRAERGDEVEGGDGLQEKEKEVTSLKEKENEGRTTGEGGGGGRRRREKEEVMRGGDDERRR
ncbi:hypothetical protein Scep_017251 [Stephania cephalantha]|uniref:Uncharacterized protein n=1 Tax=Stephania cephalantha TaxID=152367 RepID=A0AAP0IP57_9MAGN